MIYLAYFVLIFLAIRLLVAFSNLIFSQRLPKANHNCADLVSVLIPARNEEKHISDILSDLFSQDYGNIEIIVFDDLSTDRTAAITSDMSLIDSRIRLVQSTGLPEGWLGKNYACHKLAEQAKGDYLLFLDADVRVGKDLILRTLLSVKKNNLGLLSIFPKQQMLSRGEWATVPVMNSILITLLPLILVKKSKFTSLSAANGQFMLFNSTVYKRNLPHEKLKLNKVEDIAIARLFKQQKVKIACLAGNESISCRMYTGFNEAVNGFSKNVISFFGGSFLVAILFWLVTTFGFLFVWFGLSFRYMLFYLLIVAITKVVISIVSKQNVLMNLIFHFPQQASMGLFMFKALISKFNKKYEWKGRNISS